MDFNWKNSDDDKNHTGVIAQELYQIYPEAVYKPEDEKKDNWSVDYSKLVPLLIRCIQQQQKEIDTLKKKIQIKERR